MFYSVVLDCLLRPLLYFVFIFTFSVSFAVYTPRLSPNTKELEREYSVQLDVLLLVPFYPQPALATRDWSMEDARINTGDAEYTHIAVHPLWLFFFCFSRYL